MIANSEWRRSEGPRIDFNKKMEFREFKLTRDLYNWGQGQGLVKLETFFIN